MSDQTPQVNQKPVPATLGDLNLFALLSLIFSVTGFHLVGIVMGHIALVQLKRVQQRGRGFAIAGLIVGYASFALVVLGVIAFVIWMIFDMNYGMDHNWT